MKPAAIVTSKPHSSPGPGRQKAAGEGIGHVSKGLYFIGARDPFYISRPYLTLLPTYHSALTSAVIRLLD